MHLKNNLFLICIIPVILFIGCSDDNQTLIISNLPLELPRPIYKLNLQSNSGEWKNDLIRHENDKPIIEKARTIYKVLDKNSICSLVEMKPITGRKHQLRKQLYAVGHPIYGDQKYKLRNNYKTRNKDLMLHSYKIKFMINNKKYTYTALLPDYFKKLLKTKRLRFPNS